MLEKYALKAPSYTTGCNKTNEQKQSTINKLGS